MQTFESKTKMALQTKQQKSLFILSFVFWGLVAVGLAVPAALSKTLPQPGSQLQFLTNKGANIQTLTSFTDTLGNTWTFNLNEEANAQFVWTAPAQAPKVVWDSEQGPCGTNQLNFISMSNDPNVFTRTEGVTLAQTPMYIDTLGVQRTFRLQLYNADVRVESTNGDGRFFSIFGTNIFTPFGWPSSISNGFTPLWQTPGPQYTYFLQFFQNGELSVQQPNFFQPGNCFIASSYTNPVC